MKERRKLTLILKPRRTWHKTLSFQELVAYAAAGGGGVSLGRIKNLLITNSVFIPANSNALGVSLTPAHACGPISHA